MSSHMGLAGLIPGWLMRLTLIRHAQSVANAGGITEAHLTIPLSSHGQMQARLLGARLAGPAPSVWVSRFIRAQQTAAPYCQRFNLEPQVDADLEEFSVVDPALIAGLNGLQRKPHVQAYWAEPDMHRRLGDCADTFAEFVERVRRFHARMDEIPDGTVIFGHGNWLAMLQRQLQRQRVTDSDGMKAFRELQLRLPMPNCAVVSLVRGLQHWSVERERAQG
jgi:broad specificity phosphatase PhoE